MLAAGEMQISGEPLAQDMGRDLGGYSRDLLPTDLYNDPNCCGVLWIDVPGFSTGVESYEYSKQPMNNLAFESGAGTSLAYAPLVDTDGAIGSAATAHLADLVQHFAAASNAPASFVFPPARSPRTTRSAIATRTASARGGEPARLARHLADRARVRELRPDDRTEQRRRLLCSISSDDDPGALGQLDCADYECDATTLHLVDARRRSIPRSRRAPMASRAGSTDCGR